MLRSISAGLAILAATALAVGWLAARAVGAPATTEPLLPVAIKVSLTSERATLDTKFVERGSIVQFRIRNRSATRRVFAIGGQKAAVRAKGFAILLIAFDDRGVYPFRSTAGATVHRGVLRVV
jgi:hypothetical protein